MTDGELERSEVEAHLEARRELGLHYDAVLVDGFAERIERAVEARADERRAQVDRAQRLVAAAGGRQLALGIVSLVAMIPITIVLGLNGELVALLLAVAAVVSVNLAHAWQGRAG